MKIRITLPFKHLFIILLCITNTKILSVTSQDDDLLWKCDNGQCIYIEDVCDGRTDCSDGSDETAKNCIGTECRKINFVCTYGACVAGTASCNGKEECADGSDEAPALCQKDLWERQLQGNCQNQEMQCKSGECIPSEDKCDGHRNCRDGSDETLEVCSSQICPPKSFRCGYGACVSGSATCNSIEDCADGSDESAVLCKRDGDRTCTSNTGIITTTTRNPFITTPSQPRAEPCRIPYQGIDRTITRNDIFQHITYREGDIVVDSTPIRYECLKGYILKGVKKNVCIRGEWRNEWPKCFQCCTDTHPRSGYSTTATFTLNRVDVSNSTCFEPNTVAKFVCLEGFRQPNFGFVEASICRNGKWTLNKQPCIMDCGKPILPFTKFSTGGIPVNITDYPWHVGIYIANGKNFSQICTGSLISPRRVVTAAHCFFGDNEAVSPDKYSNNSPYWIAAGKYYKDFDHLEDREAVKKKITSVWIPNDFTGRQSTFHHDVSVLQLESYVPFSYFSRPVCVFYPQLEFRKIPPNTRGHFTAWNRIELGNKESTLEKVPGTVLDFDVCKQRVFELSQFDIPGDKFCVEMDNVVRVCKGDSGSGFIVYNSLTKVYGLHGVVSFSPRRTQDCSQDRIVVMTNILDIAEIINARDNDLRTEINYDTD